MSWTQCLLLTTDHQARDGSHEQCPWSRYLPVPFWAWKTIDHCDRLSYVRITIGSAFIQYLKQHLCPCSSGTLKNTVFQLKKHSEYYRNECATNYKVSNNVFLSNKLLLGREPWSSGYGWQLMFERLWVWISAP